MRLAFVASTFPHGPADTFFEPEFRRLESLGIDATAIPVRPTAEPGVVDQVERAIVHPLVDGAVVSGAFRTLVRHPVRAVRAVARIFGSPRWPVLARNVAGLPKALWLADVVERERFDHIHAHWAGPPSTVAMIAAEIAQVPWSVTMHFLDIAAGNLLRAKSEQAAFVRFISGNMMQLARQTAPGVDESRWVVVHLGIDVPDTWTPPPPPNDPAVILIAARLDPEKRHPWLLRAVRRLRDEGREVRLLIAGQGQELDAIRALADELRVADVVELMGLVPNNELLPLLSSHEVDVLALPSDGEGIPVSLMEALAAGVPAVACDVGGVAELLGDGCGELVAVDDFEGFVDALRRLLEDSTLRRTVAENGRARVEKEFSADATATELAALIRRPDAELR